ncbi:MAG TPA: hypothetical protein VFT43_01805, partial [Candidatus Polarisedimenticolia bacterium]|nr:hypothetical protein [Candidatus Polarisedimenticolia bacterium]
EVLVYDNGAGEVRQRMRLDRTAQLTIADRLPDLGPHARFAAIQYARGDLIYVQDDDVIVSDPRAIVDEWLEVEAIVAAEHGQPDFVVCNMPPEFRKVYTDTALIGFGAAFHRIAPAKAFDRFFAFHGLDRDDQLFLRESCRVFTVLSPRVLVDVPKTDLPWASAPNRLWKQPDHIEMRERMLKLAREVRDS